MFCFFFIPKCSGSQHSTFQSYVTGDGGWMHGFLTLDKHSREVLRDVLGDPQSVPGINGPIGKNDSTGSDVVAAVILISLGHGLCQQLRTDIVKLCTLFHLKPRWEMGALWSWQESATRQQRVLTVLTWEGSRWTAGWGNQNSGRIQIQSRSDRPTASLRTHMYRFYLWINSHMLDIVLSSPDVSACCSRCSHSSGKFLTPHSLCPLLSLVKIKSHHLTNDRKNGKNTRYVNMMVNSTHLPLQPARPRTC